MRDSIPTPCACNPQVLYHSDGQFFIHDPQSGHTYPASRGHAVGRFGVPFVECLERDSNCWIEFDPSDAARIGSNRDRYEALGLVERDSIGKPLFVIWDKAIGKCIRCVFGTYLDATLHIDGIDESPSCWPAIKHADGTWSVDPAGGLMAGYALEVLHKRGATVREWVRRPVIPELTPIVVEVRKLDLSMWPEGTDAAMKGGAA